MTCNLSVAIVMRKSAECEFAQEFERRHLTRETISRRNTAVVSPIFPREKLNTCYEFECAFALPWVPDASPLINCGSNSPPDRLIMHTHRWIVKQLGTAATKLLSVKLASMQLAIKSTACFEMICNNYSSNIFLYLFYIQFIFK